MLKFQLRINMNIRVIFVIFCLVFGLASCSSMRKESMELRSPCVDNGGPCKHIPVNNWWINDLSYKA